LLNGSTICVLDDNELMREGLKALLRSVGLHAEAFGSAEEFLQSGQLGTTACLIVDVQMPRMSGLEFHRRVLASGHRVPIIFITACPDPELRTRTLEAGAADYLYKPFSQQTLLDAIARCMNTPRDG
jgi:FixJ family two-component response regulator